MGCFGQSTDIQRNELTVNTYDYVHKIVILGDQEVGKSSFARRLRHEGFTEENIPTIGIEFICKTMYVDGFHVKSILWDMAGNERFRVVGQACYRGAFGFILVYDVTKQSSFENLTYWLDSINNFHCTNENVAKVIVGTKCDLTEERVVSYDTARRFAESVDVPLFEISAKTGINVEQAFVTLISSILRDRYNISII